ncbi:MAG: hypothetical protein AAFV07_20845, partial [Bacteroidota bacterium]
MAFNSNSRPLFLARGTITKTRSKIDEVHYVMAIYQVGKFDQLKLKGKVRKLIPNSFILVEKLSISLIERILNLILSEDEIRHLSPLALRWAQAPEDGGKFTSKLNLPYLGVIEDINALP